MTKYRIIKEYSGMFRIERSWWFGWGEMSGKYPSLEDAKSIVNTLHANEPQDGEVVYEDS